jgi:hypothetical protein
MKFDTSQLQAGDCLGYSPSNIFDWFVALKCWTKVSHCEIYAGDGNSYASRNGLGVNVYPLRLDHLAFVRRPIAHEFDFEPAKVWFYAHAIGQKYDWKGLLCFILAAKQGAHDRMFCSEFATRFYNRGQFKPFDANWDADRVPPSFFLVTPEMWTVWQNRDLF